MEKRIKDICKEQEKHLRSAVESGYKRATTSKEIDDIAFVYEKAFNKKWSDNRNCSICLLRLYRVVGEWWFSQIVKGLEPKIEVIDNDRNNKKNKKVVTDNE